MTLWQIGIFVSLFACITSEPDWVRCKAIDHLDHEGLNEEDEHCGSNVNFRMSPRDDNDTPIENFHIGEDICIGCNVSGGNIRAEDLYLLMSERTAAPEYTNRVNVTVVDNTTVQHCFTRHELTTIHVSCCAEQPSHPFGCCCDNGDSSEQLILKIDKVWEHSIDYCVINNWENLTCGWKNINNSSLRHDVTMFYRDWNSQQWKVCPKLGNECFLHIPQNISSEKSYCFVLNVTKKHLRNQVSKPYCIRGPDIVKPNRVKGLRDKATSTTVELSWTSPKENRSLLYEVTSTCRLANDTFTKVKVLNSSKKVVQTTLEDLQPFCNQTLNIRGKPKVGGKWSENLTAYVMTLQDIPGENPVLAPVFDEYAWPNSRNRAVTIFWKRIREVKMHGKVWYSVQRSSESQTSLLIYPNKTYKTTKLKDNQLSQTERYVLSITSWTMEGKNSSLPVSTVSIPPTRRHNDLGKIDEVAVVELNESIFIRWSGNTTATSGYTVFWCTTSECHDPTWHAVPATSNNWTITKLTGDYRNYKYGVAVMNEEEASPLKWHTCLYQWNAPVQVPNISKVEPHEWSAKVLIDDPADCKSGGLADKALTLQYIVWVCKSKEGCGHTVTGTNYTFEKKGTFSLPDLSPQEEYYVVAAAISFPGKRLSALSHPYRFATSGLKWWWWLMVALGAAFLVCLAGIGLLQCWRTQKACIRKLFTLRVHHPQEPDVHDVIVNGTAGYTCPAEFDMTFRQLATPPDSAEQVHAALLTESSGESVEISNYVRATDATDILLESNSGENVEEVEDYNSKLSPENDPATNVDDNSAGASAPERYTRTPRNNSYGTNTYGEEEGYQGATQKRPAYEEELDSNNAACDTRSVELDFSDSRPITQSDSAINSRPQEFTVLSNTIRARNDAENSGIPNTSDHVIMQKNSVTVDDYASGNAKLLLPQPDVLKTESFPERNSSREELVSNRCESEKLSVDNPNIEDYSPSTVVSMPDSGDHTHSFSDQGTHSVSCSDLNSGNLSEYSIDDYTQTNFLFPKQTKSSGDGNQGDQMYKQSVESVDYQGTSVLSPLPSGDGDHLPNHPAAQTLILTQTAAGAPTAAPQQQDQEDGVLSSGLSTSYTSPGQRTAEC